jgi:hypothetical protein
MALGVCANEYSPADGRVVDGEFGCGAHSQVVIDAPLISASTETVVDELTLEVHLRPGRTATSDAADDVVIAAGGVEAGEEPVANGEAAVAVDEEPVATEEDVVADEVVVAEVIVDEPETAPVDEQWTPAVDTAPVDTAPVDTVPVDTAPVDSAPVDVAWPAADQPDASH